MVSEPLGKRSGVIALWVRTPPSPLKKEIGVMVTKFELDDQEEEKVIKWFKEHSCSVILTGSETRSISYTFTPIGIGVMKVVGCTCGSKKDVTNYDLW